jgi:hypothetical protein
VKLTVVTVLLPTRLDQPEQGLAVAGFDHGERDGVECTITGVAEPSWLGFTMLRPSRVHVLIGCLVTAIGMTFGPPKWGEHGGGHGLNTGKTR